MSPCKNLAALLLTSVIFSYCVGYEKLETSKDLKRIKISLQKAIEAHDFAWDNKTYLDYNFFQEKLFKTSNGNTRRNMRKITYEKHKGKQQNTIYNEINFWGLCSGETFQTPKVLSEQFCWLETKSNAAWFISPLKVEQLSRSPYLIQVYDVLTETLVENIKQQVIPRLRRSQIVTKTGNRATDYRTSIDAWLKHKSPITRLISRKLELITGLNVDSFEASEPLFVGTYIFGGLYFPHLDAFRKSQFRDALWGNRIATAMFYLNDVKLGGFTAFPSIGVATKPVKGSVVIWYNLLKSGDRDFRTYHGGCPVILGHKWIGTRWIRSHAQTFTRLCGLTPNE